MNNDISSEKSRSKEVQILEVGEISPHNKAVYEAGKDLLIESISTGRDFCKFMISTSIGAIPIYIGIFSFILSADYKLSVQDSLIAVTPPIIFLIASILFTIGYLPVTSQFSLDIIDEIERERSNAISHRNKLIKSGFSLFVFGCLAAIIVVMSNVGSQ